MAYLYKARRIDMQGPMLNVNLPGKKVGELQFSSLSACYEMNKWAMLPSLVHNNSHILQEPYSFFRLY